ncbi:MAG: DUF5333 domain-containing protein [Paracoccaceae bacterium]|nr:MAG: DUF5333 domain-containing protein [Paracoccaceae bacterium]
MNRPIPTLALVLAMAAPLAAAAPVPLAEERHINEQLLAAQVGDILRKTCPVASARMLVVLGKLNDLESYARKQGYSETEVRAFLKDKAEKARIRKLAEDYLAQAGAVQGDAESYCRVARDEVRRRTLTGQLLRVSG